MRKILLVLILSVSLLFSFTSCESKGDENKMKEDIYATIKNDIIGKKELITLNSAFPSTSIYPDGYNKLQVYGKEGVPYILEYIIESENNGYEEAFLLSCAYDILDINTDTLYESKDYTEEKYTPKWYAHGLMEEINRNQS